MKTKNINYYSSIGTVKATLYLDKRRKKKDDLYPLKIQFCHNRKTCLIPTGVDIREEQWDGKQVVNHRDEATLNRLLMGKLLETERVLDQLAREGKLHRVTKQSTITNLVKSELGLYTPAPRGNNLLLPSLIEYGERLPGAGSKRTYKHTAQLLQKHVPDIDRLTFEDLTAGWLRNFETSLTQAGLGPNTIGITMRNIRAVVNYAIDMEVTDNYPFRRYKIPKAKTRKRSLTVDELREFFSASVTEDQELHLDMFKLMFFLIGINLADLYKLTEVENGRIYFTRSKTKRLYSIKVEPEAQEIIDKYRGKTKLINVFERYTNYLDYLSRCNRSLKTIGETEIEKHGKRIYKPYKPDISIYWARHTWATIASDLDIPLDTIAHALGHGGNTTSDIYIDFDQSKVDDANRKVIDWVLYGFR